MIIAKLDCCDLVLDSNQFYITPDWAWKLLFKIGQQLHKSNHIATFTKGNFTALMHISLPQKLMINQF